MRKVKRDNETRIKWKKRQENSKMKRKVKKKSGKVAMLHYAFRAR